MKAKRPSQRRDRNVIIEEDEQATHTAKDKPHPAVAANLDSFDDGKSYSFSSTDSQHSFDNSKTLSKRK